MTLSRKTFRRLPGFCPVHRNLLSNAIDALQEKDENYSSQTEYPNEITITTFEENGWVNVAIADNGPGISQDIQDKVFHYLFTTKASSKGTGMRLSISRDIIEVKHEDKPIMRSQIGKGTTFQIVLPAHNLTRNPKTKIEKN